MSATRSYVKESKKSKPVGIRYNIEEFEAAKMKSGKKTVQSLFDFLLSRFVAPQQGDIPVAPTNGAAAVSLRLKQPEKDYKHYIGRIRDVEASEALDLGLEIESSRLEEREISELIKRLQNKWL